MTMFQAWGYRVTPLSESMTFSRRPNPAKHDPGEIAKFVFEIRRGPKGNETTCLVRVTRIEVIESARSRHADNAWENDPKEMMIEATRLARQKAQLEFSKLSQQDASNR